MSGVVDVTPGGRMIWLAEVQPLHSLLMARDTPLAVELAGSVSEAATWCEREHEDKYAPTTFRFYAHPVAAVLLYDALCVVRGSRRHLTEVRRLGAAVRSRR